jgi:hypothetical protein
MEAAYLVAIFMGTLVGFVARLHMLRTDYRQYPTYPHGRVIHLSLGLVAAGMGAVAVPALLQREYTAITFLALAAQQFRDVRNMERNTLSQLDAMELVPRGPAYIEGIAMVFEGRNYLVILTAFLTSLATVYGGWTAGLIVAAVMLVLDHKLMAGKLVGHIAEVSAAPLRFAGPILYVGETPIMNVGLTKNRELILRQGLGFVLTPRNDAAAVTLANPGQRQAILHDVSVILGVHRDDGTPGLIPLARRNLDTGQVAVFLLPQNRDPELARRVIERVPVLEGAVRLPRESSARRRAPQS